MSKPEKLNLETLIDSIHRFHGKIGNVALSMRSGESTIHDYRYKYKPVQRAFKDARESRYCTLADMAELKLLNAVNNGLAWAVRFVLDTQGNRRGFAPKQQIEHSQSTASKLVVIES